MWKRDSIFTLSTYLLSLIDLSGYKMPRRRADWQRVVLKKGTEHEWVPFIRLCHIAQRHSSLSTLHHPSSFPHISLRSPLAWTMSSSPLFAPFPAVCAWLTRVSLSPARKIWVQVLQSWRRDGCNIRLQILDGCHGFTYWFWFFFFSPLLLICIPVRNIVRYSSFELQHLFRDFVLICADKHWRPSGRICSVKWAFFPPQSQRLTYLTKIWLGTGQRKPSDISKVPWHARFDKHLNDKSVRRAKKYSDYSRWVAPQTNRARVRGIPFSYVSCEAKRSCRHQLTQNCLPLNRSSTSAVLTHNTATS